MALMGAQSQWRGLRLNNFRIPALALLAVFASVQIADAWLTVVGIDRFGVAAEAKPVLALPIILFGPVAALIIAQLVAGFRAPAAVRLFRHGRVCVFHVLFLVLADAGSGSG